MREIKFRAWNGVDWLYLDEWPLGDIPSEGIIFMQYTGLKDKNGKEIYEGDIVEAHDAYLIKRKYTVSYSDGYFSPLVNAEEGHNCIDKYYPEDYEIIGNLYETPEMTNPPEDTTHEM